MNEQDHKILKRRKRTEFLDELRRKSTRQGAFEESFLHLDHPLFAGGRLLEASDDGAGCAKIASLLEPPPRWRKLWGQIRKGLTPQQRRILDALLVDYRTTPAAKIAKVSTSRIREFKRKIFKTRFAQCFRAWKRDFGSR